MGELCSQPHPPPSMKQRFLSSLLPLRGLPSVPHCCVHHCWGGQVPCAACPHPLTLKTPSGKLLNPAIPSTFFGLCVSLAELLSLRDPLQVLAECSQEPGHQSNTSFDFKIFYFPRGAWVAQSMELWTLRFQLRVLGSNLTGSPTWGSTWSLLVPLLSGCLHSLSLKLINN